MFTAFFPFFFLFFLSFSIFLPLSLPLSFSFSPSLPSFLLQYLYYWLFNFYFWVLWYIFQRAGQVEKVSKWYIFVKRLLIASLFFPRWLLFLLCCCFQQWGVALKSIDKWVTCHDELIFMCHWESTSHQIGRPRTQKKTLIKASIPRDICTSPVLQKLQASGKKKKREPTLTAHWLFINSFNTH